MLSANNFLVRIRSAPDELESMEMLELVLAGASLEVDLTVLFEGPAIDHLRAPWGRMWQQLIDHDLATLLVASKAGESVTFDLPVRQVAPDELDELTIGWRRLDL